MPNGLQNIGNTCGINTLIQCMYSVNRIKTILLNTISNDSTLSLQFLDVFSKLQSGHSLTPNGIIQCIYSNFKDIIIPMHQHDIGELWMLISNKIADELGSKIQKRILDNCDPISSSIHKMNENKTSEWIKSIQGTTMSITECNSCKEQVYNPEIFVTFSLDIEESIIKMLSNFFIIDYLPEWRCDKCKIKGGKKQSQLHKLPSVLVIQIKRFHMNNNGIIKKLNDPVNIPFDLSIKTNTEDCKYILKSIGNHYGNYQFGHYTATVLENNTWYVCDDISISILHNIDSYLVNNTSAYLLFYELI